MIRLADCVRSERMHPSIIFIVGVEGTYKRRPAHSVAERDRIAQRYAEQGYSVWYRKVVDRG